MDGCLRSMDGLVSVRTFCIESDLTGMRDYRISEGREKNGAKMVLLNVKILTRDIM